jgi:zinc-ribbon domain
MDPIIWSAVKQVIWVIAIIIVLSILAILLPFILRKRFSRKSSCACGHKLQITDTFCPKCGKKVEK